MLGIAVLSLIVLASAALSVWSWRKLRALERGAGSLRAGPTALLSLLPVLVTGGILTWRHGLAGWTAVEFLVAYTAVAYPLLLWAAYLLMRVARRTPR